MAEIKGGPLREFTIASMIAGAEANVVMLNYGKYSGVFQRCDSPRFETRGAKKKQAWLDMLHEMSRLAKLKSV